MTDAQAGFDDAPTIALNAQVPAAPPAPPIGVRTSGAALPPPPAAPPPAAHVAGPQPNFTVNVAPPAPMIITRSAGPSMLVRAVWYIFIGWWLTGITIGLAYFAAVTIIGIPIAFYLFNRIPTVLTLRPRNTTYTAEYRDGVMHVTERHPDQLAMWIRAVWFIFAGWWIGAIWIGLAYFLCLTVIGIPFGLLMFNRIGGVMTLLRY